MILPQHPARYAVIAVAAVALSYSTAVGIRSVSAFGFPEPMHQLWFWSAALNAVFILPVIFFAVLLTDGAGFRSYPALIRGIQRFMLCMMAMALACCALWAIRTHGVPPPFFFLQVMLYVNFIVSVARHITSPAIPKEARWGKKLETRLIVH